MMNWALPFVFADLRKSILLFNFFMYFYCIEIYSLCFAISPLVCSKFFIISFCRAVTIYDIYRYRLRISLFSFLFWFSSLFLFFTLCFSSMSSSSILLMISWYFIFYIYISQCKLPAKIKLDWLWTGVQDYGHACKKIWH